MNIFRFLHYDTPTSPKNSVPPQFFFPKSTPGYNQRSKKAIKGQNRIKKGQVYSKKYNTLIMTLMNTFLACLLISYMHI